LKASSALALAVAAVIFCGCSGGSRNQIYYWDGSYTDSTYQYLKQEGDVGEQIEALEKSIQKAYEKGLKVPPGLYSHLGLLYLSAGNGARARENFEKEAQAFPESKPFLTFVTNPAALKKAEAKSDETKATSEREVAKAVSAKQGKAAAKQGGKTNKKAKK
jgi:lipoprotein